MKRIPAALLMWSLGLLACATVGTLSFLYWDVPIAVHFWDSAHLVDPLGRGLGARVILSAEALVIITLVLARLTSGRTSVMGRTLVIACIASMSAYVINDHVLKVVFGVPGPADVIPGATHAFNLLKGSEGSSFPSGHMVLAGGFAGVFMRLYRKSIGPFSALLLLACVLLIVGEWHFLSDVIAGAFVGVSAGFLAAEAWAVHSARFDVKP